MKLIVGLGNPGRSYTESRHNIGFSVIKALSKSYKISLKKDNTFSLSGKGKADSENIVLAMPLTFMNLSGISVRSLLKKYRIDLEDLLIVCDDLDLEFGRLRLRPSGSSAGHGGLQSIIESLGGQGFSRLRIGIGRPFKDLNPAQYVLSPFNKGEKRQLKQIIRQACLCCQSWITEGLAKTMNIFNRASQKCRP